MTANPQPTDPRGSQHTEVLVNQINSALKGYSDKDWNYSRIALVLRPLREFDSPYVLRIESLDLNSKTGQKELKALVDEAKWGDRHSSELSLLEVVSLRINKALLEVTSDEYWKHNRAVVRIAKREELGVEQATDAIWYQITEVAGEEFDNR